MLPDLITIDDARREFPSLIPSSRYVQTLSARGMWPRLYRTQPKGAAHFKRAELLAFLSQRLGEGAA